MFASLILLYLAGAQVNSARTDYRGVVVFHRNFREFMQSQLVL